MRFLAEALSRPSNEIVVLLFPVGQPATEARVPKLERKPLDEVSASFKQ
jgi:iodotyrosine deiodinase